MPSMMFTPFCAVRLIVVPYEPSSVPISHCVYHEDIILALKVILLDRLQGNICSVIQEP